MTAADLAGSAWRLSRDGDPEVLALFRRHYTYRPRAVPPARCVGPGERLVLIGRTGKALFVWRLERFRQDGQDGINCAVFRNEGEGLASALILDAERWARAKWGSTRLFTFVHPQRVRSRNPGWCFACAGWRRCGRTKERSLVVMEKKPA